MDTHSMSMEGETMYACPMHPEERSTDPNAKCPKCGMAMEKVDDDAEEGDEHEHEGHDH